MPRMNKQQAGEIIEVFYGINSRTLEVERVSLTRGGTLTRWNKNGPYSHAVGRRNPRTEVAVVFDLDDIQSVPQVLFNSESEKRIVAELEAKVAEMRAKAGKT